MSYIVARFSDGLAMESIVGFTPAGVLGVQVDMTTWTSNLEDPGVPAIWRIGHMILGKFDLVASLIGALKGEDLAALPPYTPEESTQ